MLRSATAALAIAAIATSAAAQERKAIDPANIDSTCSPCQDFFKFANRGWIKNASIPADRASWGAFAELQERTFATLRTTLDRAVAQARRTNDPKITQLGLFYGTCMDSARADREGIAPLLDELTRLRAIRSRGDVEAALPRLHALSVPVPFSFESGVDDKNSARQIAVIYQDGLGLPDRDYYVKTDSASETIRRDYVAHVARLLQLAGDDSSEAAGAATRIIQLETALANVSMTAVEQRDPEAIYHLMSIDELQRTAPSFGWRAYLAGVGTPAVAEVNVSQPKFVAAVDSLLGAVPPQDWSAYLRWHLVSSFAPYLSAPLVTESFRFNNTRLQGVEKMLPRWRRCITETDTWLGDLLGEAYVKESFSPEAKRRALEMIANIQAEFRSRLDAVTWMSSETKTKAHAKLAAIVNLIGYPDRWRDYSGLALRDAAFATNLRLARAADYKHDLGKIGKPTDRSEWGFTAPTINASYRPTRNVMTFPAGILQPPFFDPNADDAVNYGGIGAVIGHELTHGYDDEGRQFDAQGNLSRWWSPSDEEEFNRRAENVVEQFNGYVAVDTLRVNGKLTLGENIADLGGLLIAYGAYKRSLEGKREPGPIDGFTDEQRFFLGWAQVWRGMRRPELSKLLLTVDPHSPPQWRTNGPLSNLKEFADAWGCKPGDRMVRANRADIW